jgi:hypothetical protein
VRRYLLIAILTVHSAISHAQIIERNDYVISAVSGEAQSTVVPPGRVPSCPHGRFLVVIDSKRPLQPGLVTGRDLDKLNGPDILATFNNPPNPRICDAQLPASRNELRFRASITEKIPQERR